MNPVLVLSRRALLSTSAALLCGRVLPLAAAEPAPVVRALTLADGANEPAFVADKTEPLIFRQGGRLRLGITNKLARPVLFEQYGFDGTAKLEPILSQAPLAPSGTTMVDLPLDEAGTCALGARMVDETASGAPVIPIVVQEIDPPSVDQDRFVLIEDMPGENTRYRVNGQDLLEISVRRNERLRFRLINGCAAKAVALRFVDHDVVVIAMDSRPAEPFPARGGQLVLAPGARIDVILDAVRQPGSRSSILLFDGSGPNEIARLVYATGTPLRSEPLPPSAPLGAARHLSLQGAMRVAAELPSVEKTMPWATTAILLGDRGVPAFRAQHGRTVVLTLRNWNYKPIAFRLHGHHFRWLDRLDDGWKPFVLDTMILDAGQTERIAFSAQKGDWLMECTALEATGSRLLRWFAVD